MHAIVGTCLVTVMDPYAPILHLRQEPPALIISRCAQHVSQTQWSQVSSLFLEVYNSCAEGGRGGLSDWFVNAGNKPRVAIDWVPPSTCPASLHLSGWANFQHQALKIRQRCFLDHHPTLPTLPRHRIAEPSLWSNQLALVA